METSRRPGRVWCDIESIESEACGLGEVDVRIISVVCGCPEAATTIAEELGNSPRAPTEMWVVTVSVAMEHTERDDVRVYDWERRFWHGSTGGDILLVVEHSWSVTAVTCSQRRAYHDSPGDRSCPMLARLNDEEHDPWKA